MNISNGQQQNQPDPTNTKTKFDFGMYAGINTSNFTSNVDFKPLIGVNTGFYVMYNFEKSNLRLRSGLSYSQQGAKENEQAIVFGDILTNYELVTRWNYLQFPLYLQYDFSDNFRVYAGPQLNFVVKAEEEIGLGLSDGKTIIGIENDNNAKVAAAIGLEYFLYKGLFIKAQYERGISDLERNNILIPLDREIVEEGDFNLSVFTFGLGFQF